MVKMLAPGPFPRRPGGFVKYGIVAIVFLLALYAFNHSSHDAYPNTSTLNRPLPDTPTQPGGTHVDGTEHGKPASRPDGPSKGDTSQPRPANDKKPNTGSKDASKGASPQTPSSGSHEKNHHPIDKLIYDAQHHFAELTSKESKTVQQAAQAYRKRRGRHPPPGFDKWFEFARSHSAIVIEDFFDQIHHDMEPFWGLDALLMRREASQFEMTINVRDGNATSGSDWFWTNIWLNMVKEIEQYLPDMDLALNAMDEPRLVVPWEDINSYMTKAAKTVKLPKAKTVVNEFQKLPKPRKDELSGEASAKEWEKTSTY